uniref:1,4-dihydroxy-2-naphthoate octaprenyltransferase n=1 Tax=Candidatus Methanophagaceae archaeon ANME-1 ERB6 TaxID=2759912 RepID=A0A7G9YSX0_9EURY|nr:1,4-dihydroxy-2-naphthoate octaprenyltransferase [Methanosarcinales archaeon ANME-1 ERB6]
MNINKDMLSGWVELSGLPKFTTTLIPFLLGAVLARADGYAFDGVVFAISLLAVFLLTDFCFVLNACSVYADLKQKGIDFGYVAGTTSTLHSTAVSGRFDALVKGRISVNQAVTGAYLCALAAFPLGVLLHFYFNTGGLTLLLGLLGIIIPYSYSRGLRLSYHGLGEIALTAGVGWLTVFSGYYLQSHQVSWLPTIVALPLIIDAFKLKLTREIPDFDCDLSIDRRNLAIRLGKVTTVRLYLPLTVCSWLAFIPILFLDVPHIGFGLLAIPVFFTAKSLIAVQRGDWKTAEGLSAITKNAFTGMILIPVALIGIFILKIVLSA